MKESFDTELINHIAQKLKRYEEPYELGSWESFRQMNKKRKSPFSIGDSYGMVASFGAILLLTFIPLTLKEREHVKVNTGAAFTAQIKLPVKPALNNLKTSAATKLDTSQHQEITTKKARVFKLLKERDYTKIFKEKLLHQHYESTPDTAALIADFQPEEKEKMKIKSKWDFAVVISPAVSNSSKVNLGAGFSIAYALSNKLSIRSGLSINSYYATKLVSDRPSSKMLTSVDASIGTLDIPLEIMFSVNKKVYASAGLSSVTLFRQNVAYNYQVESKIMLNSVGPNGEIIQSEKTILQDQTENATSDQLSRLALVGFYNFNIGYRYPLLKNHQLIIEPFIKIPASKLNIENVNFTLGGLMLKYKF